MYDFFYRMNARTLYLFSIPPRYRYPVTSCILLVLINVWFFGIYRPLLLTLNKYQQVIIDNAHAPNAKYQEQLSLQNNVDAAEKALDAAINAWQSPRMLDVVNELFSLLSKHALTFCSYTPQAIVDEGMYTKHSLLFDIKGSFTLLHDFFMDLATSKYLLFADMVRFTKNTNDELSCTCLIYVMQIKKERDEKK